MSWSNHPPGTPCPGINEPDRGIIRACPKHADLGGYSASKLRCEWCTVKTRTIRARKLPKPCPGPMSHGPDWPVPHPRDYEGPTFDGWPVEEDGLAPPEKRQRRIHDRFVELVQMTAGPMAGYFQVVAPGCARENQLLPGEAICPACKREQAGLDADREEMRLYWAAAATRAAHRELAPRIVFRDAIWWWETKHMGSDIAIVRRLMSEIWTDWMHYLNRPVYTYRVRKKGGNALDKAEPYLDGSVHSGSRHEGQRLDGGLVKKARNPDHADSYQSAVARLRRDLS